MAEKMGKPPKKTNSHQDAKSGGSVNKIDDKNKGCHDVRRFVMKVPITNASFGLGVECKDPKNRNSDFINSGLNARVTKTSRSHVDSKRSSQQNSRIPSAASSKPRDQLRAHSQSIPRNQNRQNTKKERYTSSVSVDSGKARAELLEPMTHVTGKSSIKEEKSQSHAFSLDENQNKRIDVSPQTNKPTVDEVKQKLEVQQINVNGKEKEDQPTSDLDNAITSNVLQISLLSSSTDTEQEKTNRKDSIGSSDSIPSNFRADGRFSAYDQNNEPLATEESQLSTPEAQPSTSVGQPSTSETRPSSSETKSSTSEVHPSMSGARPKDKTKSKCYKDISQDSKHNFWHHNSPDLKHDTKVMQVNTQTGNPSSSLSSITGEVSSPIKVRASRKSIIDWEVDVLVSSDNSKLQSGGMVAKLISERGGRPLQIFKESVLFMCQSIKSWTFQPTPAACALKSKHVFHAVVPQFSDQNQSQWVDRLKCLMKDILRRTEQFGYKSIALPIIGSGRNSAPQAFIIDLICAAIKEYMADRPNNRSLETIVLVHPDRLVEKYIEKQIKDFSFTGSGKPSNPYKEKDIKTHFLEVRDRKTDTCPICMEEIKHTKLRQLSKCKHIFCKKCLEECFKRNPSCPVCNMVYRTMTGNQPEGTMIEVFIRDAHLPGYDKCGIIKIFYFFPDGMQGKEHAKPGVAYKGTKRSAYLPDNEEGQKVHRLFRRAFDQRVLFTIGSSRTTGKDDVVTWNDIHHKTSVNGGPEKYGYPDPTYISRVLEELAAKGITEE